MALGGHDRDAEEIVHDQALDHPEAAHLRIILDLLRVPLGKRLRPVCLTILQELLLHFCDLLVRILFVVDGPQIEFAALIAFIVSKA